MNHMLMIIMFLIRLVLWVQTFLVNNQKLNKFNINNKKQYQFKNELIWIIKLKNNQKSQKKGNYKLQKLKIFWKLKSLVNR